MKRALKEYFEVLYTTPDGQYVYRGRYLDDKDVLPKKRDQQKVAQAFAEIEGELRAAHQAR